jgi:hypothetical protein
MNQAKPVSSFLMPNMGIVGQGFAMIDVRMDRYERAQAAYVNLSRVVGPERAHEIAYGFAHGDTIPALNRYENKAFSKWARAYKGFMRVVRAS